MYKLEFTLKQHTPIIHFQHEQEGATLRASEVKPKLDRYIFKRLSELGINHPEWISKASERVSLSFKLNFKKSSELLLNEDIPDGFPCFFGNMKKKGLERKHLIFYNSVLTNIESNYFELVDFIGNLICDFFNETNFGTRQSKGFGSFYPDSNSEIFLNKRYPYKNPGGNFYFSSAGTNLNNFQYYFENFKNLFSIIDLFYRALRSGINQKGKTVFRKIEIEDENYVLVERKNDFYFKPLLFFYLYNKGIQWDKKTIKEELLPKDNYIKRAPSEKEKEKIQSLRELNDCNIDFVFEKSLNRQKSTYPNSDLFKEYHNNEFDLDLYRDLFGLSTEEQWLSYNKKLTKTHAVETKTGSGEYLKRDKKHDKNIITRFSSPIFIKPIYTNGVYKIYISLKPINKFFIGQPFIIEFDNRNQTVLVTNPDFKFEHFFKWIADKKNINIEKYIDREQIDTKNIRKTLISIFNEIQK